MLEVGPGNASSFVAILPEGVVAFKYICKSVVLPAQLVSYGEIYGYGILVVF